MLKEDAMDRKEVIGSNPVLSLGQEIFDRTDGMCVIGPGPGGIGVTNPLGSKISLMLLFKPDPIQDAGTLTDGETEIEVRVAGYDPGHWNELSENALKAMAEDKESPVTRKIASAVLELSRRKQQISYEQYNDAFACLADWEIQQEEGIGEAPVLSSPVMG